MSPKRTFIGKYREFYPERTDLPTMKDNFEEHPYPGQGKIIYFLMHGISSLVGMCSVYDIFTGERIRMSQELLFYGNFEWWGYLVHYVKKYNLRLPSEFEEYILKTSSKAVYENYKKNYW